MTSITFTTDKYLYHALNIAQRIKLNLRALEGIQFVALILGPLLLVTLYPLFTDWFDNVAVPKLLPGSSDNKETFKLYLAAVVFVLNNLLDTVKSVYAKDAAQYFQFFDKRLTDYEDIYLSPLQEKRIKRAIDHIPNQTPDSETSASNTNKINSDTKRKEQSSQTTTHDVSIDTLTWYPALVTSKDITPPERYILAIYSSFAFDENMYDRLKNKLRAWYYFILILLVILFVSTLFYSFAESVSLSMMPLALATLPSLIKYIKQMRTQIQETGDIVSLIQDELEASQKKGVSEQRQALNRLARDLSIAVLDYRKNQIYVPGIIYLMRRPNAQQYMEEACLALYETSSIRTLRDATAIAMQPNT